MQANVEQVRPQQSFKYTPTARNPSAQVKTNKQTNKQTNKKQTNKKNKTNKHTKKTIHYNINIQNGEHYNHNSF